MKPSYYLEPDAGEMQSFFRSLSLQKAFTDDLAKISINKIWIDEAENSWELEYFSPVRADSGLLSILSEHIKASFNLKSLAWKRLQDNVSSAQPVSDIRSTPSR